MNPSSPLRGAVAKPVLPNYGARTELRLVSSGEDGARYEARWFLGNAEAQKATTEAGGSPDAHGLATIAPSGEVHIELAAGHLPDWALSFTDKLLRTTARGVQAGRYPRRLTRWRDAPA